jgi:hypothetical protein
MKVIYRCAGAAVVGNLTFDRDKDALGTFGQGKVRSRSFTFCHHAGHRQDSRHGRVANGRCWFRMILVVLMWCNFDHRIIPPSWTSKQDVHSALSRFQFTGHVTRDQALGQGRSAAGLNLGWHVGTIRLLLQSFAIHDQDLSPVPGNEFLSLQFLQSGPDASAAHAQHQR